MKKILSICLIILFILMSTGIYAQELAVKNIEKMSSGFDFDIIQVNDIDVILPEGGGVMLVTNSYGLLVNTGTEPISKGDLRNATVVISSNCKNASMGVGFNIPYQHFSPIEPGQAWGSINESNRFLTLFLEEDEELVNMTPAQTFYLEMHRDDFIGVAYFNISIKIRKNICHLETKINFSDGPHDHTLKSGNRINSVPYVNKTLYVGGSGPGNFTRIRDAIDIASNGDTVFVYDDSSPYYENLIVDKPINLVGENKATTIIEGDGNGSTILVDNNHVNISRFSIRNCISNKSNVGITIYAGYSEIKNNLIYSNRGSGINIHNNNNNSISNNLLFNNRYSGIIIFYASNNTISNNSIHNTSFIGGIDLIYSHHNIITNNFIENCSSAMDLLHSYKNIICNNNFISKGNGVFLNNCFDNLLYSNHVVGNSNFYGSTKGLWLFDSFNNSIKRNKITNYRFGVFLEDTDVTKIENNTLLKNIINARFIDTHETRWFGNYWNRPRILPKPIFGIKRIDGIIPRFFEFDWHPAKEPYEMEV